MRACVAGVIRRRCRLRRDVPAALRLIRVAVGGFTAPDLAAGEWRELSPAEIRKMTLELFAAEKDFLPGYK